MLSYLEEAGRTGDTYLQAYALYVLTMYGRNEKARADSLAQQGDEIGVFGYGFLGLSYQAMGDTRAAQRVLTRLKNFVRVGTRTVTLVGTVNDWLWYGGEPAGEGAPADAVRARPARFPARARARQRPAGLQQHGLLGKHEQRGVGPPGVLGDRHARATRRTRTSRQACSWEARSSRAAGSAASPASPFTKQVPAKDLGSVAARERGQSAPSGTLLPLTFGLTGKGTLYYTAELRYALLAAGVEPRDEGIGIATEILDDKGAIVTGTDLALGKVYTMRVVFYSSQDRTYLALRAPIPSGAEPIDGSLLTSQIVKPAPDQQDNQDSGIGERRQRVHGGLRRVRLHDAHLRQRGAVLSSTSSTAGSTR